MRKNFTSLGFTIIETLLVLSLIAIIAALALPRLGGAANQRDLEMVAQNLASDIRLVQQLNINSGGLKDYTLYFASEKGGGQYYLINDGNANVKKVSMPKTVKWISPKDIQFTVTGAPAVVGINNSSQTIMLKSSDGGLLYIKIAPVTGRVRVTGVASAGDE